MSLLKKAVETNHWEVAALCLLLGALEAAEKLPRSGLRNLIRLVETPSASRSEKKVG